MKKLSVLFAATLLPLLIQAQGSAEKMSLDERINEAFAPIANAWAGFVFTTIPLGKYGAIPFVVVLLVAGALAFTLFFSFVNVRKFPLAINVVRGHYDEIDRHEPMDKNSEMVVDGDVIGTIEDEGREGEVSHFQALATAVSGTVGLGNIAGVAVAIAVGGPGATFWMIVCGLLGMSSKFVECTLGVKYRDVDRFGTVHGGPMYYLSKGIGGPFGKILGVMFAVFCVGASFGGGNAFQSNQAAQQISSLLGLTGGSSGFIIGIIMAVLVAIVIIGGIKRIASVTEKIVPFMAVIYVVASVIIILFNIHHIGTAFGLIINGAFNPSAGLGGMLGVLIVGFQRAAFSNEAGAGSAAIAHSAVRTKYAASEGIVALLEPFIDTVVICTMTALVIIFFNMDNAFVYGVTENSQIMLTESGEWLGGVDLTSRAFDAVLPGFSYILTIAIILFAFSTMISWSYYGLQSWKFLFGRSQASDLSYKVIYLLFVVVGASATLDAVITFSDAMVLALVFPNMIGLFILAPKVKTELNKYLAKIKSFRASA